MALAMQLECCELMMTTFRGRTDRISSSALLVVENENAVCGWDGTKEAPIVDPQHSNATSARRPAARFSSSSVCRLQPLSDDLHSIRLHHISTPASFRDSSRLSTIDLARDDKRFQHVTHSTVYGTVTLPFVLSLCGCVCASTRRDAVVVACRSPDHALSNVMSCG